MQEQGAKAIKPARRSAFKRLSSWGMWRDFSRDLIRLVTAQATLRCLWALGRGRQRTARPQQRVTNLMEPHVLAMDSHREQPVVDSIGVCLTGTLSTEQRTLTNGGILPFHHQSDADLQDDIDDEANSRMARLWQTSVSDQMNIPNRYKQVSVLIIK